MTSIRRRQVVAGAAAAALSPWATRAFAQARSVTLVVPAAPGGTTDIAARMLAQPLAKILDVPVVVDNRAGGNGNIAGLLVSRANGDGSTLLVQYSGYQCITPLIQPVPGFDPGKDLTPVAHLIDAPQVLVTRADFPASDFAQFIAYLKAHPGKVNYASSGNGSLQHVTTELLKDLTKTFATHIPYRGTGPALTDLLAGNVDFTITTPPPLLGYIRAGKLKALATTGRTRINALPNVPTAIESHVSLVASSWFAVYGPAKMPPDVQRKLSDAISKVVRSEPFRKLAEDQGAKAVAMTPAELATLGDNERNMWHRVVKVANIRAD
jgi:tripartite-type tricarboxylate transporter receptor subunit TctC